MCCKEKRHEELLNSQKIHLEIESISFSSFFFILVKCAKSDNAFMYVVRAVHTYPFFGISSGCLPVLVMVYVVQPNTFHSMY